MRSVLAKSVSIIILSFIFCCSVFQATSEAFPSFELTLDDYYVAPTNDRFSVYAYAKPPVNLIPRSWSYGIGPIFKQFDFDFNSTSFDITTMSNMHFDSFVINKRLLSPGIDLPFDSKVFIESGTIALKTPLSNDAGTQPVPEPATFILLGSGLAAAALYRRRRDH